MKSVLISIQPKWCELIASGKKIVEVRKTKPKVETPFKVYIYCTQASPYNPVVPMNYEKESGNLYICGKNYAEFLTSRVIGEFVCDEIIELAPINQADEYIEKQTCLSREQIVEYLRGKGYAWHISDLVIYDEPKELSVFKRWVDRSKGQKYHEDMLILQRPPQSWCYVEEVQK